MPRLPQPVDPRIDPARRALQAFLAAQGMTTTQLETATGVSQPQISKFLAGQRKRWSVHIQTLCQYAGVMPPPPASGMPADEALSRAVRQVLGDDARAVGLVVNLLHALEPAFAAYRQSANDTGGPR